jgi:DNA-directed RNA polymerase specialized sigma24 family protein
MSAIHGNIIRDKLFEEILDSIQQWPEFERSIFCEAHYCGRSPEAIARSFDMDIREVHKILKECDRRLHNSLEDFI